MDQSTEKLLKTSSDGPIDGICNDIDSGPTSFTFDVPILINSLVEQHQRINADIIPPIPTQPPPIPTQPPPESICMPSFAIGAATCGNTLQLPQYRTRHLSCIIENWSESESYNSLPPEVTIKKNDDVFTSIANQKPVPWEAEDLAEYITTLDESCILDIESIENVNQIGTIPNWQSTVYGPKYQSFEDINKSGGPVEKYPKIMTTSCYGTLNNPFIDIDDQSTSINSHNGNNHNTSTSLINSGSSENLLQNIAATDQYIAQQLISNEAKCRSPISTSMTNSIYDGSTSMNNSFYQSSSIDMSANRINSLESSMTLTQTDDGKIYGDENTGSSSNMTELVNCGKFLFYLLF